VQIGRGYHSELDSLFYRHKLTYLLTYLITSTRASSRASADSLQLSISIPPTVFSALWHGHRLHCL